MRWLHYARALAAAALLGGALHANAAGAEEGFGKPVDAATLDAARGGFETPGGLSLALGIERVVSVNGEVLSRSSIAIPDLSAMTADQARLAHEALGSARLIQLGGGNIAGTDTGLGNGATLVQNTLNDQTIRAATVITSTVNSMSLLKDLNFHSTIRDALVRSAGNL